jgi:hypothetical protein
MICTPGEQVTINFGSITYYKTPAAITFTKGVGTETKQGNYLSEKVTCVLSTNDSKVVTNQVITLTCSSSSSYNKTYTCTSTSTSGDSGFVQYIPYGYRYTISVSDKYSYNTPSSQTYTANTTTRNTTFQYVFATYTVQWLIPSNYGNKSIILDGVTYTATSKTITGVPANAEFIIPYTNKQYAWCDITNIDHSFSNQTLCYSKEWKGINKKITSDTYVVVSYEID